MQQIKIVSLCLIALVFIQHVNALESTVRGRGRHGSRKGINAALKSENAPTAPVTFTQIDESEKKGDFDSDCIGYVLVACGPKFDVGANLIYAQEDMKANMTTELCYKFCGDKAGVWGFGLEGGDTCFCTPFQHEYMISDESDLEGCDLPCAGNASESCGGESKALLYELDNCANNPLVCEDNMPEPVDNAQPFHSEPYGMRQYCENLEYSYGDTTQNNDCKVTCLPGYYLKYNSISCVQKTVDGSKIGLWEGEAKCVPMSCGSPECISYASTETGVDIDYPNSAMYRCKFGYTTNGKFGGNTTFKRHCLASAVFSEASVCKPITCGLAPELPYEDLLSPNRTFTFSDRALYKCKEGYTLDASATGKTQYWKKCLAGGQFTSDKACEAIVCGEVREYKNATYVGESIKEVSFPMVLKYKCDTGFSLDHVRVLDDSNSVFNSSCTGEGTMSLTVTPCVRVSCGYPRSVNHSLLFPANFSFYQDEVFYYCDLGYTTTGKAGGPTYFKVTCGADGMFAEELQKCLPVQCGKMPVVGNATANASCSDTSLCVFPEEPSYTCNPGYSLIATDDPFKRLQYTFSLKCMENGVFEDAPVCVNIDNCLVPFVKNGGEFGDCVDNPIPTGDPESDYTIVCHSGYEITKKTKEWKNKTLKDDICTNIDDCPTSDSFAFECGGSDAGKCVDDVNAYHCDCKEGYIEVLLKDLSNTTCAPVGCSQPPQAVHAKSFHVVSQVVTDIVAKTKTTVKTGDMVMYEPVTPYKCDSGYTLTGYADGIGAFNMSCMLKNGSVTQTEMRTCKPVTCGPPYDVENSDSAVLVDDATTTPDELFYPQKMQHFCSSGYTNDSSGVYIKNATVLEECKADGSKSPEPKCIPVKCGKPSTMKYATVPSADVFYPDTVEYKCDEGYSTDGTTTPGTESSLAQCEADAGFSQPKICRPVVCGSAPVIQHASTDLKGSSSPGIMEYPNKATYTVDQGYSVDGTCTSKKTFEVECLATSKFTQLKDLIPIQPVSCGTPPTVKYAQYSNQTTVYLGTVSYTCLRGYSTDGEPAGGSNTGFLIKCQDDCKYTAAEECKPVVCKPWPELANAEAVAAIKTITFPNTLAFKCGPGFSLTGRYPDKSSFDVPCLYDGSFEKAPTCVNIDDCLGNRCTSYGKCIDHKVPKGIHIEDYTCKCDSGFKEVIKTEGGKKYKTCENIDDCPDGGCAPGVCQDLINSYACICPKGFYNDTQDKGGAACFKQSCGTPPAKEHTDVKNVTYKYEDSVSYNCLEGYTLDGKPKTSSNSIFTTTCNAGPTNGPTGIFAHIPEECKPVVCGIPPTQQHTTDDATSAEITEKGKECSGLKMQDFEGQMLTVRQESTLYGGGEMYTYVITMGGEIVQHTRSGIFLVGKHKDFGDKMETFQDGDGKYCPGGKARSAKITYTYGDKLKLLKAVEPSVCYYEYEVQIPKLTCQEVAYKIAVCTRNQVVFPEIVHFTCALGYSTERSCTGGSDYSLQCTASGKFEYVGGKEVKCDSVYAGEPKLDNADYDGSKMYFPETRKVKCNKGYSLDGSNWKNNYFTLKTTPSCGWMDHGNCTIMKCGEAPEMDFATKDTKGVVKYEEKVTYKAVTGYTFNGKASGPKTCQVQCLSTGQFSLCSPVGPPKPVVCNTLEEVPNSRLLDSAPMIYQEVAPYDCHYGYSTTGVAAKCRDPHKGFTRVCQADGTFTPPKACLPVECGVAPKLDHAHQKAGANDGKKHVFRDTISYECDPGYSLDKKLPSNTNTKSTVFCKGDGNFQKPKRECENINDCEVHMCSPNGRCEDNPVPTGNHSQDYKCICDSGFEVKWIEKDGKKFQTCHNIPDCPDGACEPGQCQDLVNDYKCICPAGYHTCENKGGGDITHDCCPDSCGVPPARKHSKPLSDKELFFPEKVDYKCDVGYTLDGSAEGETVYAADCVVGGLTFAGECEAIVCSAPNDTAFATKDVSTLKFPEKVTYTCTEGYTLEAKCEGTAVFSMSCNAEGFIVNEKGELDLPQCKAVSAGTPTEELLPFSIFSQNEMFYKQTQNVTCMPGYSTDPANEAANSFTISATQDCKFDVPSKCLPMACGAAPAIDNSKMNDTSKDISYPTSVTYTADPCYSVDGTAAGIKSFSTTCNEHGKFDSVDEYSPLRPISCGSPPEVAHAQSPVVPKTCKQTVKYECDWGYSTDELPVKADKSNGEFVLTCQASGEYTKAKECKKVKCDPLPAAKKATKVTDGSSFTFRDTVLFECEPGYSTDGLLNGDGDYEIQCLGDGRWTELGNCTNMDDCMDADCIFGTCVDNKEPTGKHIDDYHCDCIQPGYKEEMVKVGTKTVRQCVDIDNCTEAAIKACGPGHCIDEVADYECACPDGYFRGEGNHTCEKQSCGSPPVVKYSASVMKGAEALLYGDNLTYTCDHGYSWSGTPKTTLTFTVQCEAKVSATGENVKEGNLTGLKECLPVGCGNGPPIPFASTPNVTLEYKDEITYKCEEGYSTKGTCDSDSKTEFTMRCDGTGEIVFSGKGQACLANRAGKLGDLDLPNVDFQPIVDMHWPQTHTVNCVKGYSIDPKDVTANKFVIKTTKTCGFAKYPTCTEIFCEDPPEVAHATFVGKSIFGQEVMYTCDTGYSLDGKALTKPMLRATVVSQKCSGLTVQNFSNRLLSVTQESTLHGGGEMYTYDIIIGKQIIQRTAGGVYLVGLHVDPFGETEELFKHGSKQWCGGIARSAKIVYQFGGDKLTLISANEPSMCSYEYTVQIPDKICEDVKAKQKEVVTATFNLTCDASGKLSKPQECFPVQCGQPRVVQQAKAESTSKILNFADNKMKYTCDKGYTLDGKVGSVAEFTTTCQADGTQVGFKTCLPVECTDIANRTYSNASIGEEAIVYKDSVKFVCLKGYSIDGKVPSDTGSTEYEETCQADGTVSNTKKCKDINFCVTGDDYCGKGGKCIDQLYGYKCSCLPGYEELTATDDKGVIRKMCVEINECEDLRWNGNKLCKAVGDGKCVDGLNKFTCDCSEGYEAYDMTGEPKGRQMCRGVTCGMAVVVANSMPLFKRKVVFPNNVGYTCDEGFTTTAVAQGPRTFTRSCQSNKQLTKAFECQPVKCPEKLPVVPFSTVEGKAPLSYLQDNATYTCMKGYSIDGFPDGKKSFVVKCNSTGIYVGISFCQKVTCGEAPAVTNANFLEGEKFYQDVVGYKCFPGYSTDAKAGGVMAFDVTCEDTGNFSEAKTCNRISCGKPKTYSFAQQETQELFFKDRLEVSCENGYSVTGFASGADSFVMKCAADGSIVKVGKYEGCKPVSCGLPTAKDGSIPDSPDVPVVYGESRTWNCKPKYSIDGLPSGNTSFELSCEATGRFSETSPTDCIDINFCQPGNPCGMNGDCFDCTTNAQNCKGPPPPGSVKYIKKNPSKIGKHEGSWTKKKQPPSLRSYKRYKKYKPKVKASKTKYNFLEVSGPPFKANEDYACSCKKGYETTEEPGFLTCTEDDCKGAPCGTGGQCIDLSGRGIEGAYDCQCKKGYKKTRNDLGKWTCTPYVCKSEPPSEPNSQVSRLNVLKPPVWTGRKGAEVIAWDSLFYKCDYGYSQDGTTTPTAKMFTAHCNENGILLGMKRCRPIQCDNIQIQQVPDAYSVMPPANMEQFYEYKNKVEFTCYQGFTLGDPSKPSAGPKLKFEDPLPTLPDETFSVTCLATGVFSDPQECKRRSCGRPGWIRNGMPSKSTEQFFDDKVQYSCKTGYETWDKKSNYTVRCNPNGLFTQLFNCYPIKCYRKDGSWLQYGKSLRVDCPAGMKTEFDLEYVMESCQADKSIKTWGTCKMMTFHVTGYVTDASDKDFMLGGCQLALTKQAVSAKSCKDLGWIDFEFKTFTQGAVNVCGTKAAMDCSGPAPVRSTHADAEKFCESQGARLCSEYEMRKGESCGQSCSGYDDAWVWTSTPCASGMKVFKCETGNAQCKKSTTSGGLQGRCCADTTGGGTGTSSKVYLTAGEYTGKYDTYLMPGNWHCKASYPDYIDATIELAVNTNLISFRGVPGAGDIALTKKMANDEWRIVIGWGETTWDMDSWTNWGAGLWSDGNEAASPCECGWYNTHEFCGWDTSGVSAVLERDETQGFGPETTYLKGVGNCVKSYHQSCILTFSVINYTPESKSLQASSLDDRAVITVYRGSEMISEMKMSELMSGMGQDQTSKVMFTIDLSATDKFWKGWPYE